jgi:hypothetical protein
MSKRVKYGLYDNYNVFVVAEAACYDGFHNYEPTGQG